MTPFTYVCGDYPMRSMNLFMPVALTGSEPFKGFTGSTLTAAQREKRRKARRAQRAARKRSRR